jgi:hypothetical protein
MKQPEPEMPEAPSPAAALKGLLRGTARAARETQKWLDGEAARDYWGRCHAYGHQAFFSIPAVSSKIEFGLVQKAKKKFFFITRGRTAERHRHVLRFTLLAVPEPPPPPAAAQLSLIQPAFLAGPDEERRIIQLLEHGLENDKWDFAFPLSFGNQAKKPQKLKNLRNKVRSKEEDRIEKARDGGNKNADRLLVFRLAEPGSTYLVVRLAEDVEKDGLFEVSPEEAKPVMIYSCVGYKVKQVRYDVLHRLALGVRRWLAGGVGSRVEYPVGAERDFGVQGLEVFVPALRQGYVDALRYLAGGGKQPGKASQPGGVAPFPCGFDMPLVEAELTYSAQRGKAAKAEHSFDSRPDGGDAEKRQERLLGSRVLLRARRVENVPRVEVELVAPEFVLSGAAQARLVRAAVKKAQKIARKFGRKAAPDYLSFLLSPTYQSRVLAFLSYEGGGDPVPKQEFLIIWPGAYRGQERDFVFTCKGNNKPGKDFELKDFKPILKLDQVLTKISLNASAESGPVGLSKEQYKAFHNFFNAVWLSRVRVRPNPVSSEG